ncbi:cupin domain-containing protein [Sphingomonas xanthus]|uniref:Cupin domain-containing protein n=1 Tax=Sphingomonas xanthus TaxID=2594473 RepID=A0A516IU60_9SPHN|nr:cupin domain-containing protein [Sphingomonas xanthus]QDP20410.1 cupin domain-containing protein [Sphingomonas xanthus]
MIMTLIALSAVSAAEPLPEAFDAGWKGQKVCEVLRDDAAMRVGRCTFPPGVGHERHWHRPHWGYIVQGGTMRITDAKGTVERKLMTGASWSSDGVGWHEVVNVGPETAIYLIIEPKPAR